MPRRVSEAWEKAAASANSGEPAAKTSRGETADAFQQMSPDNQALFTLVTKYMDSKVESRFEKLETAVSAVADVTDTCLGEIRKDVEVERDTRIAGDNELASRVTTLEAAVTTMQERQDSAQPESHAPSLSQLRQQRSAQNQQPSSEANTSAANTLPLDPKKAILGNLGISLSKTDAETRVREILTTLGIDQAEVRTIDAWQGGGDVNYAHVLFVKADTVTFLEMALKSKAILHVPGKSVWAKVSVPRHGPGPAARIKKAAKELEFLESEVFGAEAGDVSFNVQERSVSSGGQVMVKMTRLNKFLWSVKGKARFNPEQRAFYDAAAEL